MGTGEQEQGPLRGPEGLPEEVTFKWRWQGRRPRLRRRCAEAPGGRGKVAAAGRQREQRDMGDTGNLCVRQGSPGKCCQ